MRCRAHWLGPKLAALRVLSEAGADLDERGDFKLSEGSIIYGLGNVEIAVPTTTWYYVNGHGHLLSDDLEACGDGIIVNVY